MPMPTPTSMPRAAEQSGSCDDRRPEPMSLAASDQVLAKAVFAKSLPYVDTSRWQVN